MAIAEGTVPVSPPAGSTPGARNSAAGLSLVGAVTGGAFVLFLLLARDLLTPLGITRQADAIVVSLYAAAVVFMVVRYLLGFGQPRLFR